MSLARSTNDVIRIAYPQRRPKSSLLGRRRHRSSSKYFDMDGTKLASISNDGLRSRPAWASSALYHVGTHTVDPAWFA